jgi:hypothetical protein
MKSLKDKLIYHRVDIYKNLNILSDYVSYFLFCKIRINVENQAINKIKDQIFSKVRYEKITT